MAKIKKHAEILDQLHSIVKKSTAQESVTGAASQLGSTSVSDKTEKTNKNEVGPDKLKTEVEQKPSVESAGESVSSKSASFEKLSNEILGLLNKASADAQETVTGKPTELNVTQVSDKTEDVDKNKVGPDKLTTEIVQKPSVEDAGKAVSSGDAKSESKVEVAKTEEKKTEEAKTAGMASKIAAYQAGASIVRDLLKQSGFAPLSKEADALKLAGQRDMEHLINEAAANLKHSSVATTSKIDKNEVSKMAKEAALKEAAEAEVAGAAYFDELYKVASAEVVNEKQASLEAKLAEMAEQLKAEKDKNSKKDEEKMEEKKAEELAIKVAAIVVAQLKSESKPVK